MRLQSDHLETIKKILSSHVPQYEVRAFGSRVHGKHLKPFSDLDLAVMTEEPLSVACLGNLQESFSGSDLPFKVDVVDWAAISEEFRRVIQTEYEVIQALSAS